ncbi:MAG: family 16 glycosylhydrolase [Salinibacter sp.]
MCTVILYLRPLVVAVPLLFATVGCDSGGGGETEPNTAPTATFTVSPSTPTAGAEVQFDASASSDEEGAIASYEWTIGKTTKTGAEVRHTFPETVVNKYGGDARYEVTLTVTDADGATDSTSKGVRVSPVNSTVTWKKVWGDEFEGQGLPNGDKWYYETGGDGWGNQEKQYYTREDTANARVEDGHLIIEARKESYRGNDYTSARLNSEASWKYGRFEIRAKLPAGRGTWPALWMLPDEQTYGDQYWPDNGEMDIMEHVGYDEGVIHGTIHTEAFNHIDGTEKGGTITVPTATSAFHDYAMEWTPNDIRVFVDGEQYFTFQNREQYDWQEWPFDQKFHLLMNIAVGGTWGGAEGIDDSAFPERMVIDYVRVYKPE